jgi:hypothetical protein
MRRRAAVIFFSAACWISASPVLADDTADVFFIAMRAPNLDPAPRYISVYEDATDTVSQEIAGCDGETYYATPDDATVVSAAIANGNIVELQAGATGTAPQDAGTVCVIQSGS